MLLPSTNEVAERLCFYTCLSFCPQRGGRCLPQCMLGYTPPGQTPPPADTPWANTPLCRHPPPQADTPSPGRHPPSRRLLLRTVRILLECILVLVYDSVYDLSYGFCQDVFQSSWLMATIF